MGYNNDVDRIDTTTSRFESFVKSGMLYVDKSMYAYSLLSAEEPSVFRFIARPRRFGKSLFISMLEAALEGRRGLFDGLYLGSSDYDFHPYPVIHLDMSMLTVTDGADVFRRSLIEHIWDAAKKYDLPIGRFTFSPSDLFMAAIMALHEKAGEKVAILIDEYDSPLNESLKVEDGEIIRAVLKGLYGKLKPCADHIRFLFMTGITRFSNQSLFSKLNNMRDLTFSSAFSSAFGYTQAELEAYFDEGIGEYMEKHPDAGREGLLESLRHWYDGYRFSEGAEKVYNPVSINSFFRDDGMAFEPYWANTASTEMVVELAKRARIAFLPDDTPAVMKSTLMNFSIESFGAGEEISQKKMCGYLYMAGYLTIDHIDGDIVHLAIPNHEVGKIMGEVISEAFIGDEGSYNLMIEIEEAMQCGDIGRLASAFDRIIHIPTYDMRIDREKFYQALIYAVSSLSGKIDVRAEEHTAEGRSDLVLAVKGRVVIVELKMNQSAEASLAQIESRNYMDRYTGRGDDIILMGVNIATKGRGRPRLTWQEKRMDERRNSPS